MYLDYLAVFRLFLKNVTVVADINRCGGDNFLTDCVNRRVCNLSKHLLEVIKQRLIPVGKYSNRTVSTHCGN